MCELPSSARGGTTPLSYRSDYSHVDCVSSLRAGAPPIVTSLAGLGGAYHAATLGWIYYRVLDLSLYQGDKNNFEVKMKCYVCHDVPILYLIKVRNNETNQEVWICLDCLQESLG